MATIQTAKIKPRSQRYRYLLANPNLSASLRLVLQYFLDIGAHIKKVFSLEDETNVYIVISYKGEDIWLRSSKKYFYPQLNSLFGVSIAADKLATSKLLQINHIAAPRTKLLDIKHLEAFSKGKSVIKPNVGSHGRGVSIDISSVSRARKAVKEAKKFSSEVLVQKYIYGKNYRLLFINYKFVAAIEKIGPRVVGDGRSTIAQLVRRLNKSRSEYIRNSSTQNWMKDITSKISVEEVISQKGKDFVQKKPGLGEEVELLNKVNISLGARSKDVTSHVNKALVDQYSKLLSSLGLGFCGIDVISSNITAPPEDSKSFVIELNYRPGLLPHVRSEVGRPKNIGRIAGEAIYQRQRNLKKVP